MNTLKKKLMMSFLSVILLAGLFPTAVFAEGNDDFTITDGVLTAYTGTSKEVVIPDGVTSIGEKAFYSKGITSVVIPDSVKRIEKQAFYGNSLNTVSLSEGLEYIGNYAFDENYSQVDIIVPASVTEVGSGAFGVIGEGKVCSVTFLNPNTVIPSNAMEYFAKLTIWGAKDSTAQQVFNGWKEKYGDRVKSVFIPTGTKFSVDPATARLHRQDTVQLSIASEAEDGSAPLVYWTSKDPSVATVDKNGLVTGISEGKADIEGKTGDKVVKCAVEVIIEEGESDFKVDNNGTITEYVGNDPTNIVVPEKIQNVTVTAIKDGIFKNMKDIKTVVLPSTLTKIGEEAFAGCSEMTSINLGAVKELSRNAFRGCLGLENVTLGDELVGIPEGVFSVSGLKRIVIPGSAQKIEKNAFSGCRNLSVIVLKEGVRSISEMALLNCPLVHLHLPASFEKLGDNQVGDPFEEGGKSDADPTMTTITVSKDNPNFSSLDGILYSKDGKKLIFCPRCRVTASIPD